jgi:hypothetical protein
MTLGIGTFREPRMCANLPRMLAMPFIGAAPAGLSNRRGGP